MCSLMWSTRCSPPSWKGKSVETLHMYAFMKALTTFFLIKEAHFNRLWSPMLTSVFKVEVTDVVLQVCNRNTKATLVYGVFNAIILKTRWHKHKMNESKIFYLLVLIIS